MHASPKASSIARNAREASTGLDSVRFAASPQLAGLCIPTHRISETRNSLQLNFSYEMTFPGVRSNPWLAGYAADLQFLARARPELSG